MAVCMLCKKRAHTGSNVSHSQIHTKRKFRPNLQKVNGLLLCTQCLRTLKRVAKDKNTAVKAEAVKVES